MSGSDGIIGTHGQMTSGGWPDIAISEDGRPLP